MRHHHLAILGLLIFAACGGGDPKSAVDEGKTALGKGDYPSALEAFEASLAGLDVHHPQYLRAALGRCEALARLDPPRAMSEFLELAKRLPEQLNEDDYSRMSDTLLHVDANLQAVEVIHAGKVRFPNSKRMDAMLDAVLNAAKRAKTPEALQRLKDLGYA